MRSFAAALVLACVSASPAAAAPPASVPSPATGGLTQAEGVAGSADGGAGTPASYERNEEQTYLTLPEWYIVYASEEYARFITDDPPSGFPYFRSIALFWQYYARVYEATLKYPFNGGYHLMIGVIGVSHSVEYGLKAVYENTLGRFAEWTASSRQTEEERFAAATATDYVAFIRIRPWYEYPFRRRLGEFWTQTNTGGLNRDALRRLERKLVLSVEYGVKAAYGWLIGGGTQGVYAPESEETFVRATGVPKDLLEGDPKVRLVRTEADGTLVLALPRYQPFTTYAVRFARRGVRFVEIAGNGRILVTAIGDRTRRPAFRPGELLFAFEIPIEPGRERLALTVPVPALGDTLAGLEREGVSIEHVYDY